MMQDCGQHFSYHQYNRELNTKYEFDLQKFIVLLKKIYFKDTLRTQFFKYYKTSFVTKKECIDNYNYNFIFNSSI